MDVTPEFTPLPNAPAAYTSGPQSTEERERILRRAAGYGFGPKTDGEWALAAWINPYIQDVPAGRDRTSRAIWAEDYVAKYRDHCIMCKFLGVPLPPTPDANSYGRPFPWDDDLYRRYREAWARFQWSLEHEEDTESEFVQPVTSSEDEQPKARRGARGMRCGEGRVGKRPKDLPRPAPRFPNPMGLPTVNTRKPNPPPEEERQATGKDLRRSGGWELSHSVRW